MSNLVDRYLLFRIRTRHDPEAFAQIYDRYVKALYRFNSLKLPSREDAQDVTAETFTKAWNYLQGHKEVTNIRALLYRISRNLIADHYRNRPVSVAVDAVTEEGGFPSTYIREELGSDRGVEREMMEARAEMSIALKQLGTLKEDYRDVVMLRSVDGLAFDDIADILGKTTGNVRVIYHRALKTLKDLKDHT
ncbi:RNA polymerase sigma factor [Candidatus Uhrbacteria bacterium]|nr:RNA polymerase sigma factor [Candidatus Uhrbacteria bacterium]